MLHSAYGAMCNPINPLSQNNEDLMKANVVALVKEEENERRTIIKKGGLFIRRPTTLK